MLKEWMNGRIGHTDFCKGSWKEINLWSRCAQTSFYLMTVVWLESEFGVDSEEVLSLIPFQDILLIFTKQVACSVKSSCHAESFLGVSSAKAFLSVVSQHSAALIRYFDHVCYYVLFLLLHHHLVICEPQVKYDYLIW